MRSGLKHNEKEVRAVVYPNVSHLTGMMSNRELEKKLYRMVPVIGFLYKSFGKYKKECMKAKVAEKFVWCGI